MFKFDLKSGYHHVDLSVPSAILGFSVAAGGWCQPIFLLHRFTVRAFF